MVLWLLLLFRVLGSTAENFFSPILTQLSQEMGLPPRFAGGVPSGDSQTFSVHCSALRCLGHSHALSVQ